MAASPHLSQKQPSLFNLPDGLTPGSIDTIPILSSLLSRLQNPPATASTSGSPPAASPANLSSGTGSLNMKDIPTATDAIKHNLQKARNQVRELPDIDRSIEEQELEIKELEAQIRKQKEALMQLRDVGSAVKTDRDKGKEVGDGDAMQM